MIRKIYFEISKNNIFIHKFFSKIVSLLINDYPHIYIISYLRTHLMIRIESYTASLFYEFLKEKKSIFILIIIQ